MTPTEAMAKHNLIVTDSFIAFSRSRNRNNNDRSLNWSVSLVRLIRERNGMELGEPDRKVIMVTDYSAGIGHIPKFEYSNRTLDYSRYINQVCETGIAAVNPRVSMYKLIHLHPKPEDVLYSLLSDSEVLNYRGFEDWASSMGYDTDSRKAEAIYKACMKTALELSQEIKQAEMAELREAFQDY